MIEIKNKLFKAFAEDHAVLGNGFHILSSKLREGKLNAIKAAAQKIDKKVGAHIAFEQFNFYPKLKKENPGINVDEMYQEHQIGLDVILNVMDLPLVSDDDRIPEKLQKKQLEHISIMERHITECGDLFAALDTLPKKDLIQLYEKLLYWREKKPKWSDVQTYKEELGG